MPRIDLQEWETRTVAPDAVCDDVLAFDADAERAIESLAKSDRIEILALPSGLRIRANSWVGQVTIGKLTISVRPKISGLPLVQLLQYAYSLRDLHIRDTTAYPLAAQTFQDLLITQLAEEVSELLARGLHRDYRRFSAPLASPKGRIDFPKVVSALAGASAAVDCIYFERDNDILLNRALLSGLRLARSLTHDAWLQGTIARLQQILAGVAGIAPAQLSARLIADARRSIDRRTTAYSASLTLIELLLEGFGSSFEAGAQRAELPGFLFDMNRFFQALLSRFLHSELHGFTVLDERRLKELFVYDPTRNPRNRVAGSPRPDFSVMTGTEVVALLDAKYRDLWESRTQALPREMLYQLAIYALGQPSGRARSTILYPCMDANATDQAIHFRDPVRGHTRAEVILRPVHLPTLAKLVSPEEASRSFSERRNLVRQWVFGCRQL